MRPLDLITEAFFWPSGSSSTMKRHKESSKRIIEKKAQVSGCLQQSPLVLSDSEVLSLLRFFILNTYSGFTLTSEADPRADHLPERTRRLDSVAILETRASGLRPGEPG